MKYYEGKNRKRWKNSYGHFTLDKIVGEWLVISRGEKDPFQLGLDKRLALSTEFSTPLQKKEEKKMKVVFLLKKKRRDVIRTRCLVKITTFCHLQENGGETQYTRKTLPTDNP